MNFQSLIPYSCKAIVSRNVSTCRVLSGIFGLGEIDPKIFAAATKYFLGLLGGGDALPENLKIQYSGLAEIAFLDISSLH